MGMAGLTEVYDAANSNNVETVPGILLIVTLFAENE